MRRFVSLLLFLCLLCPVSGAEGVEIMVVEGLLTPDCLPERLLAPGEISGTLDEQSAVDAGLRALGAHHPQDADVLAVQYLCHANPVQLTNGRRVWVASMFGQMGKTPVEAVITLDADTGGVIRYEENNTGWFRQTQEMWEVQLGRYGTWPLDRQVLYDALYCLEIAHATLPEGYLPENEAYEIALEASGLSESRGTLRCERSLALDIYTRDPAEQYVWMITLCLGDVALAQVNISAATGNVIDVFDFSTGVG